MLNTIEQAEARAVAMRASWVGNTMLARKGAAVAAVYQLKSALEWLDPDERRAVMELLAEELGEFALTVA